MSVFIFLCSLAFGSLFALEAYAQSESEIFFIESSYDLFGRKELEATLIREDRHLQFYGETSWWDARSAQEQNDLRIAMAELGLEFQNHIYPVLTSTFGREPKPGIDSDERITILVHQMGSEGGGYFRINDVYERLISPTSNQREMLYLNSRYVDKPEAKSFLAHEFTHIITVQQKDLSRRVSEEFWLNEARAEYASTLLGYDNVYRGSNLERRVRDFLKESSDSLLEWFNQAEDYGVANLFIQYVVDHYGVQILVDSLQSSAVGTASIDEALRKNGFQKNFRDVFQDWSIAVLMNDCSLGEYYCYRNPRLKDLRITPISYFIPRTETVFSTYHTILPWSANPHRLVGGAGNLFLEFDGSDSGEFRVPYVLCGIDNVCSVSFFSLDEKQKQEITFPQFDAKYSSLTLIPFVASESSGNGQSFDFSWQVRVERGRVPAEGDSALMSQLLTRIAELQEQVRQLQQQLAVLRRVGGDRVVSCARFDMNLSFGMRNEQVRCLQEFLAAQGPDVYPEALITGNFLSLTRQAVIRFQEKYAPEILAPFGLGSGTGYVGQMTRNKMNQLLGSLVVL